LGVVVVVGLIVPALSVRGQDELVYRDDFGAIAYSGSDGNIDWTEDPWIETGESDGPSAGQIHIGSENCSDSKCLHIEGEGLLSVGRTATRAADLSDFGSAQLSYEVFIGPGQLSSGTLFVEVKGNGSGWTEVASYVLVISAGRHEKSVSLDTKAGADFGIRFRLSGLVGGDVVAVDRVVIAGDPGAPATTTSSSSTTSTSTSASSSTTSTPTTSTTHVGGSELDRDEATETTTSPGRSDEPSGQGNSKETTTTTIRDTTTSSHPAPVGGSTTPQPPGPLFRETGGLLMVDYDQRMFASGGVEVLGVSLDADYSLAVEMFEPARIWLSLLTLLVAAMAVVGLERWRVFRAPSAPQGANRLS
jgi:hypothetical protein